MNFPLCFLKYCLVNYFYAYGLIYDWSACYLMFFWNLHQFRPPWEKVNEFSNYLISYFDRYFKLQFWVQTTLQVYFGRSWAFWLDLTSWSFFHSWSVFISYFLELLETLSRIALNWLQLGLILLFGPLQFRPMTDLIYFKDKCLNFCPGSYLSH